MGSSFVKFEGLLELGRKLQMLNDEVQTKIARRSTAAGAAVINNAAKTNALKQPTLADAPFKVRGVLYQPGYIAENIITKRLKDADTTLTSEHIVTVRSNKANNYAGRIAAFNEFGTVEMPAQPFMRPAFDEHGGDAAKAIVDTMRSGIMAAAAK